jgi:DNA-binding response OmpR family regulator
MTRVLVIDDNAGDVELIKAYLQDAFDEVCCVTDSRLVESEFAIFEPDVVVLDIHMPPPDGFEVLRRLRGARDSLGFLPILVLSGDTSHVTRNSALILGADEFVTKPVDREGLVLRVRSLLRTREAFEEARHRHSD